MCWRPSGASSVGIDPAQGNTAGCKPTSVIPAGKQILIFALSFHVPSLTCWSHVEKPLCTNLEGRAGAGAAPQLTHFNCSS